MEKEIGDIVKHHAPFFMKYETVDQAETQLRFLLQSYGDQRAEEVKTEYRKTLEGLCAEESKPWSDEDKIVARVASALLKQLK